MRRKLAGRQTPADQSWIPLVGHSGAEVFLIKQPGSAAYVRKIAAPGDRPSERLRLQARKQEAIARILPPGVRTPQIVVEGDLGGRYFFDMPYIDGLDGISFIRSQPFGAVRDFTRQLVGMLETLAKASPGEEFEFFARIEAKCREVAAAIWAIDPVAAEQVEALGELAGRTPRVSTSATFSHGDLTLENIVVSKDGTIWLFDLLDSFIDHPLADIAKIAQDLRGGWYLRRHQPLPTAITHFIAGQVEAFARRTYPELFALGFELMVATTFARILPYSRSAEERGFVLKRLDYFLRRARRNHLVEMVR